MNHSLKIITLCWSAFALSIMNIFTTNGIIAWSLIVVCSVLIGFAWNLILEEIDK